MSSDRPRRPRPSGSSARDRGKPSGGAGKPGKRQGKPPGKSGRPKGGTPGGSSTSGKPAGRPGKPGKPGNPGRDKPRTGASGKPSGRSGKPDNQAGRRSGPPRTEAERRAAEVRARRGPRRTPRTPEREQEQIEGRSTEEWVDEGSVRDAAEAATRRASTSGRDRRPPEIDPEVVAEIRDASDARRAERLAERLASASAALDRERFDEARRMVAPLVKELPSVAAVHEVSGLASYRTGRWRQASRSLEQARALRPDPSLLPVLADCYRALHRWHDVDRVWREIRETSPPHDVMAEGRIVAASALADQGELQEAIAVMEAGAKPPKRVRDHHLRQWYVLGDLYDRAGDPVAASRWFREVADRDAGFADVRDRLRGLGR